MAIIVYRTVQTGPNSQLGGDQEGLLRAWYQLYASFIVFCYLMLFYILNAKNSTVPLSIQKVPIRIGTFCMARELGSLFAPTQSQGATLRPATGRSFSHPSNPLFRQMKNPSQKWNEFFMARELGFEPRTHRLTAGCSTAELLPNILLKHFSYFTINLKKINPRCLDPNCQFG